jgi:hypothetical protein
VVANKWNRVSFALSIEEKTLVLVKTEVWIHGITVNTFHSRMVLSSDPDAIVAPSGLQDIVEIPARWPSNVWMSFPLCVSQTLTAPSAPRYVSHTPSHGRA